MDLGEEPALGPCRRLPAAHSSSAEMREEKELAGPAQPLPAQGPGPRDGNVDFVETGNGAVLTDHFCRDHAAELSARETSR
jgi:hypothetical protein